MIEDRDADKSYMQLLVLLPLVAWIGNALYAVGEPGGFLKEWSPAIAAPALIAYVFLHGRRRYGGANLGWFILIVFAIGWISESVSMVTEFPFGNYHYTDIMAPFLGHVPVFVLPAYVLMGYFSWSMATLLMDQREAVLKGWALYTVPLVAAGCMVVWDLSMDPLRATVEGRWIWLDGGAHYGVPIENYFGWFAVTWLMFQSFALLLRVKPASSLRDAPSKRQFWVSIPMAYSAFAVEYMLNPLTGTAGTTTLMIGNTQISLQVLFAEIAALCLLTMVPLAFLATLRALRMKNLADGKKDTRAGILHESKKP